MKVTQYQLKNDVIIKVYVLIIYTFIIIQKGDVYHGYPIQRGEQKKMYALCKMDERIFLDEVARMLDLQQMQR